LKDIVGTTTQVTGGKVLDRKQQEALTSPGSIVEGWCVCGVLLFKPASRAGKQQSAEQYLAEFSAA
jgi:hypothetical protein